VTIYERDASLDARREGYGLTLTYHPTGVLAQLGILEQLALEDCPSRSHYLIEQASNGGHGRICGYFGNDFAPLRDGWGQRGNLRVPRQRVREILVEQLLQSSSSTRIHWDHKLTGIRRAVASDKHSDINDETVLMLQFANGVTVEADVVIAADGIRSSVVQQWIGPRLPPPRSLGVRIILGITTASTIECNSNNNNNNLLIHHELLRERGFYTLTKGMRLFVMPYQGSALGRSLSPDEPVRYMWQLSFAVPKEDDENENGNSRTSEQIQIEALQRTQGWHEPVQSLIRSTDSQDVWGTLLRDRDPMELQQHLLAVNNNQNAAVLVAGDALHAMSPFKGQGANRCLHDGLILAKWLAPHSSSSSTSGGSGNGTPGRCSKKAAIKNAQREMVQRTAPIVQASRASAQYWHSPEALQGPHPFAGVDDDDHVETLLNELERRNITAETKDLDHQIQSVIQELGMGQKTGTENANGKHPTLPLPVNDNTRTTMPLTESTSSSFAKQALEAASAGALERLRQLAWGNNAGNGIIRRVVDPVTGGTCLHLAAVAGHAATVHWLVTQAGCDCGAHDGLGRTALELVATNKHVEVWEVLNRLQNNVV